MTIFDYLSLRTEWETLTGQEGTIDNMKSFLSECTNWMAGQLARDPSLRRAADIARMCENLNRA